MEVAVLDEAREERRERLARVVALRGIHPNTRWLAHMLDDRAHRRTADGGLACGEPVGALVAADHGTPPCRACFP